MFHPIKQKLHNFLYTTNCRKNFWNGSLENTRTIHLGKNLFAPPQENNQPSMPQTPNLWTVCQSSWKKLGLNGPGTFDETPFRSVNPNKRRQRTKRTEISTTGEKNDNMKHNDGNKKKNNDKKRLANNRRWQQFTKT